MKLGKEIRELDVKLDDGLMPPHQEPAPKSAPEPEPQETAVPI